MSSPLSAPAEPLTAAGDASDPPIEWELHIAETRTGRLLSQLPLAKGSTPDWQRGVNNRGSLRATVPIYNDMLDRQDLLELAGVPNRYSAVLLAGTWCAQAGPIGRVLPTDWPEGAGDENGPTVTLEAKGLWDLIDSRLLVPATYPNDDITGPDADTVLGPLSYRTIIKRLLQQMETRYRGDLPLVYEPDYPGPHTRTYPGYDLAYVGERIFDITQLEDGSDVEFRPRLTVDRKNIEWQVLTGDPYLGQSGSPHVWVSGADIVSITPTIDGTRQASAFYLPGQGTERGRLVGYALNNVLIDLGYPMQDLVIGDHNSVTEVDTLNAYARAYAELLAHPIENWDVIVTAVGGGPVLSTYESGDDALFQIQNHPWIPDGDHRRRIIDLGPGPTADTVKLTVAPVPGRF